MHRASKVNPRIVPRFWDRAERIGKVEQHKRYMLRRTPQKIPMYHIAGVEEEDPRYWAMKMDLMEKLPTGKYGWPSDWIPLATQMGEKAPQHLVPHGGTIVDVNGKPIEPELPPEQKRLLEDTARELYRDYLFTGTRLTKEAALGPYEHERSAAARAAMLMRHKDILDKGIYHRAIDMPRGASHLHLLFEHDIALFSYGVTRRQANKPKARLEAVADSPSLMEIDYQSQRMPAPAMVCRYRSAQGAAGVLNLAFATEISGMVKRAEKAFPRMLKHRSAFDVAADVEKFFNDNDSKGDKRWLLAFDVSGMEKHTPTYASKVALERLDTLLGDEHGIYRVTHNNPTVEPMGKLNDFLISCENFHYTDDSNMAYGTRSGRADVVATNQIAVLAALKQIFIWKFGWNPTMEDFNGDSGRILNKSKTDDNMLAICDEKIYQALRGQEFSVMGMTITFEEHGNFQPGKAAPFLATTYAIEGRRVVPYKNMLGGIINMLCSESGADYSEELKFWRRNSPKGEKQFPLGVGYVLRMQEYLMHPESGVQMWDMMKDALHTHLGMAWHEAFPCTKRDITSLEKAMDNPDAVDALAYILTDKPDYIHRAQWDPDMIPEELQDRMFLRVGTERYREIFGDAIPMEDPEPMEPEKRAIMPNLEEFKYFVKTEVLPSLPN